MDADSGIPPYRGSRPLGEPLVVLGCDLLVLCDAQGTITWADERARQALGSRPGDLLVDLVEPFSREKVERFFQKARIETTEPWELVFLVAGEPTVLALYGAPYGEEVLVGVSRLPQRYIQMQEQATAALNDISALHRELSRRQEMLAQTYAELASAARQQAQLEGVLLTVRELAQVLNDDLSIPVGLLDLLREHHAVSPAVASTLAAVADGLDAAVRHVAQFQQITRVVSKDSPVGPSLDLEQSIQEP